FFSYSYLAPRDLHSFPTRRSSDLNGILGVPLSVTATIVVAYIFFGQALCAVGGDKFLTDLAMAAMGRFRGGPAKMAVVSSSLYRSEEHTSELQSRGHLVCRLLLEK